MIALLIFLSVLIIMMAGLTGWLSKGGSAGLANGFVATVILAEIWLVGLVVYVAQHFVTKYW